MIWLWLGFSVMCNIGFLHIIYHETVRLKTVESILENRISCQSPISKKEIESAKKKVKKDIKCH